MANEQLTASNLSSGEQVAGGMLGISKGHVAVTIKLTAPQGVNGNIQRGDNITVFATFTGASIIKGGTVEELVNGTATTTDRQELPDFTGTLIPTVRVLQVVNPGIDEAGNATGDSVTLTLDLLPEDAQNLILAHQTGTLYFGLLPPGEDGRPDPRLDPARAAAPGEEGHRMTEASVVAVGTPQSFRQQIARALEVETEEIGWAQSATVAEELLINAFTPIDVLVLSPEVKEPDALGLAEFVGRQSPGTAIVLVRDHTWNGLLPAAMRAGIRDVVDMTQGTRGAPRCRRACGGVGHQPAFDGRRRHGELPQERGHIISVFSSKGGSGKTFLTTNLAAAISDITGQDTAVVDLDTDMGDVFTYFGREPSARVDDMMGLGEGADHERIREIGVPFGEHLWGFGSPPDPAAEPPAGEAVGKFLRTLRADFSYVVVDASVDYSDSALVCFDLSDAICLVTPLDVVGVKHLSKALDTLLTIGLPRERFRVVLNRADSKVGLDSTDVERVMKITVDAMIPSSRLVPTALEQGAPGGAGRAQLRRLDRRPAARRTVHQAVRSCRHRRGGHANGNGSKPEKKKRKRFSRTAS